MKSPKTNLPLVVFTLVIPALFLVACQSMEPGKNGPTSTIDTPPAEESEGVLEAMEGRIVAEWLADPAIIHPGESVSLRVVNQGEVELNYGRPITVERWNGSKWRETKTSREAMWTMEMLNAPPGETGVEQTWPFLPDQQPDPGWYRITKRVRAVNVDSDPGEFILRARVQVRE